MSRAACSPRSRPVPESIRLPGAAGSARPAGAQPDSQGRSHDRILRRTARGIRGCRRVPDHGQTLLRALPAGSDGRGDRPGARIVPQGLAGTKDHGERLHHHRQRRGPRAPAQADPTLLHPQVHPGLQREDGRRARACERRAERRRAHRHGPPGHPPVAFHREPRVLRRRHGHRHPAHEGLSGLVQMDVRAESPPVRETGPGRFLFPGRSPPGATSRSSTKRSARTSAGRARTAGAAISSRIW